jgi:hypothetical protein
MGGGMDVLTSVMMLVVIWWMTAERRADGRKVD